MTSRTLMIYAALAGAVFAGAAGPVRAAGSETKEQAALLGTKVTLSDAIAAAERQTGGKAYDAGVDT